MTNYKLSTMYFLFAVLMQPVYAGVNISPVILEVDAENHVRSTTITLQNGVEDYPRNYELTAYKWTQNEQGEEQLEPSNELVMNPKTFNLATGEKQTIRIGFRQAIEKMNIQDEQSWRILFQEIPTPLTANGIQVSVDMSIPLFVTAKPNEKAPNLGAEIVQNAGQISQLKIINQNDVHIKTMGITVVDTNEKTVAQYDSMKYILAHKSFAFDLGNIKSSKNLKAIVKVDQIVEPLIIHINE